MIVGWRPGHVRETRAILDVFPARNTFVLVAALLFCYRVEYAYVVALVLIGFFGTTG